MSSSAAVAISAATLATVQQGQREDECRSEMPGFEHDTATVQEARQYADCVDVLHPDPMSDGVLFMIKVFIVWALAGAVINIIHQWNYSDLVDKLMFGIFGAAGGLIPPGLYYIIKFLVAG